MGGPESEVDRNVAQRIDGVYAVQILRLHHESGVDGRGVAAEPSQAIEYQPPVASERPGDWASHHRARKIQSEGARKIPIRATALIVVQPIEEHANHRARRLRITRRTDSAK